MTGSTWAWGLAGIVAFLVVGVVVMLALGVLGLPGTFARRLGQTAAAERTADGRPLPDEVPDATAAEIAEQSEEQPER
jgi:hypothetical protein